VDEKADGLYELGSRAIAVVEVKEDLYDAEKIAEQEINRIKGPLFHRKDIGTRELVGKKTEMMKKILCQNI
jgi:phosphoribosylamine--glycine ligase